MEQAEELLAPSPHPSVPGVLRRRPVGVVAVTTPFPFPVYGAVQVLAPTLLAGAPPPSRPAFWPVESNLGSNLAIQPGNMATFSNQEKIPTWQPGNL